MSRNHFRMTSFVCVFDIGSTFLHYDHFIINNFYVVLYQAYVVISDLQLTTYASTRRLRAKTVIPGTTTARSCTSQRRFVEHCRALPYMNYRELTCGVCSI